jgi:hypothetical protein
LPPAVDDAPLDKLATPKPTTAVSAAQMVTSKAVRKNLTAAPSSLVRHHN